MWNTIFNLVGQYGPFPVGIAFGVWIKSRSMDRVIDLIEREKVAIRQEKRELLVMIEGQHNRIEKLHEKFDSK